MLYAERASQAQVVIDTLICRNALAHAAVADEVLKVSSAVLALWTRNREDAYRLPRGQPSHFDTVPCG